tara:strand:+ start:190 stop:432 length:243 start_codon:yes stop_codon:yes gene_type:complete
MLLEIYLVVQGLLLLYFVRWVLWRNHQLTDLIVWKHQNADRMAVLDRFKTSRPAETPEPQGERYSVDHLDIKPIEWALEE